MVKKIFLNIRVVILFAAVSLLSLKLAHAGYDDFTLNVPNAQGGYTAIVIKKSGNGYVGPQGEYYPQFPTVAQLQVMYGLGAPAQPVIVPVATPVTYVPEPQVQEGYQVVNQAPYEERHEDEEDQPLIQPSATEIVTSNAPREDEDERGVTLFKFKKKKKSSPAQSNNQNTAKSIEAKSVPQPSVEPASVGKQSDQPEDTKTKPKHDLSKDKPKLQDKDGSLPKSG